MISRIKNIMTVGFLMITLGLEWLPAQNIFHHPGMFYAPAPSADAYRNGRTAFDMNLMQPGEFRLNMNMGSSFSSFSGYGNAYGYYLNPVFSFQASQRFRLSGGVVFSSGHLNAPFMTPGTESSGFFSGPSQSMLVYTSGQYMVNSRLLITGTAYKNFSPTRSFDAGFPHQNLDFHGMSMSMDYKLTKGISLGASFHYDNRPFGFGYQPMYPGAGFLPVPWR